MSDSTGRRAAKFSLSLTTAVGTTPEINTATEGYKDGSIHIPSGSSITTLTYHGATSAGGTYLPIYSGGTAVTQTVAAGRAYQLPTQFIAFPFVKIVADAAGSVEVAIRTDF